MLLRRMLLLRLLSIDCCCRVLLLESCCLEIMLYRYECAEMQVRGIFSSSIDVCKSEKSKERNVCRMSSVAIAGITVRAVTVRDG
jgi:hypothetical protein